MKKCKGIDISTGSTRQGLSCGAGMAIAGNEILKTIEFFSSSRRRRMSRRTIWEAAQTAVKYQLDNLVVFVDNNRLPNRWIFVMKLCHCKDLEKKI